MSRTALLFVISAVFLLGLPPCAVSGESSSRGPEGGADGWNIVQSSYATIFVDKDIDIGKAAKRIDVGFARYDPVERELFFDKGLTDDEQLANKIDIIVRKDKKTLDMNPHGFHINIRVYENDRDMWDVYEDIFKEREDYRSFYIHKFETVYISLSNLNENVLAHEIGHAIIDHYFAILPPHKIRELLACYCDVHLKD